MKRSSVPHRSETFETVKIERATDLGFLLGDSCLPRKRYTLIVDHSYCFMYNKFLYGIYQCIEMATYADITNTPQKLKKQHSRKSSQSPADISPANTVQEKDCYVLEKTSHYHRLRLHHTSDPKRMQAKLADKRLLSNLFRDENKAEIELFLKILDQKDHYLISCAGRIVPGGIQHYRIREPYQEIQKLAKQIQKELQKPHIHKEMFFRFTRWGTDLANMLLPTSLQKTLAASHVVYSRYDKTLPLSTLMIHAEDSQRPIPFATISTSLPTIASFATTRLVEKDAQRLTSLGVFTSKEDRSMIEEIASISKKYYLEKSMPPNYCFGDLYTEEILSGLSRYDLVHLIYHGEIHQDEFMLMRAHKPFLKLSDLAGLSKAPKVLLMSTCYSENTDVLNYFFRRGGQTLITTYGEIVANGFPEIMRAFYWQLFTRRSTVRKAFHSTMKNLYKKEDLTVFKLKIHGYGDEFFNERETL